MDDLQEALTRYMVRRVSLRKIREQNGETSVNLQRKYQLSPHHGSSASKEDQRLEQTDYYSLKTSNFTQNSSGNNENLFSSGDKYSRSIENLSTLPNEDSDMRAFELSSVKGWSKPSKNSANAESKRDNKIEDGSTSIDDDSLEDSRTNEESPKLLRVREIDLGMPTKLVTELRNIEIAENRAFLETLPLDESQSSITSLTEVIENLDIQIKNLEMQEPVNSALATKAFIENAEKLYPILEEIKFESTGYAPRKNLYAQLENLEGEIMTRDESMTRRVAQNYERFVNEKNLSIEEAEKKTRLEPTEKLSRDESFREHEASAYDNKFEEDGLLYPETPRTSRKMPIMESTRKSPHSDSTRIKFPTPNRVDPNSISSIGISGIEEHAASKNRGFEGNDPFDATIPYEVEHFLEEALGDEIFNATNVTYATCEGRERTDSHFTASELISHDRTPLHRRIVEALKPPMTEPVRQHSRTLNRSMEIYRSFSQRIKKKFRSGIKARETPPAVPSLPSEACETDKVRELLQEVNVQQTLINQATKALNLCNAMKEFTDSSERIELERLLLLAGLRKNCVIEEIKKITSSEENKFERNCYGQRSEITLSEMKLNLRETMDREGDIEEMVDWFVLIISQGFKIWATRPMSYQRMKDPKICFPDVISLPELSSNFKIQVEVYTMKVRKSSFNHEEKYRIRNKQKRGASCPPFSNILVSPTKLFKKIDRPCTSPRIHYSHQAFGNKATAFVLSGFVELFLHDLTLSSPWPLMLVPNDSILHGTIDLNLACRLHLSVNHEGFVNDGDESGGLAIWNRRWCVFKGHTLMYWNYPDDQETKEPLKIVDLINCVSSRITTADRTICAKPRTLLFETARPRHPNDRNSVIIECRSNRTIIRHLMSLDSTNELMEWSAKLNHVILALREWNVIHPENDPQVSDL
ncbi:uncharacterized protein [Venturia canescens]|uniref:uncharacterized protein isoform X2 n=1 Tax=Venturia canescens TaxID=32260 RepID=UPI001C9BFA0E|nr:uncharacterized protein LOC122411862 isoform X2 [Venturia canescens]